MKKQGGSPKYTGEERQRDATSIFKKFFETAKKPAIVNTEAIVSAKKVVAGEAKTEFNVVINQVFGVELKHGEAHSVGGHKEETHHAGDKKEDHKKAEMTSEHMQYFAEFKRTTEGRKTDEASIGIKQQLEQILAELRNLKASSDELQNVFKDVVVDDVPDKPGVYHLTFYEGFLKLVMKMRDKVQDGVVYAKLYSGRKAEKGYQAMAKKGGTSFTQHHDRAVATQTG
jgi:hypothetical protein